jgi:rod shape determining protein RodA
MTPIDRRLITHANWPLFGLLLVLFLIGAANLYSASGIRLEDGILAVSSYYKRQLLWGGIGLACLIFCMFFDYRHLRSLSLPLYVLTMLLLVLVLLAGARINGATRWLQIGGFTLQPSELAKISVLITAARVLSSGKSPLGWSQLADIAVIGLLPAGLIALQPDLGTCLNVLLLLGGMVLFRGIKIHIFRFFCVLIPLLLPIGWYFLKPYQQQRILTFIDPSNDPLKAGYHIIQSQIAIGSGQTWGKGFLSGTQNQLRFLPEKHTDFAIAVFGEEWGFVGCLVLLFLFCCFLLSILTTVRNAKDRFGGMLAAGVFLYFFWQFLINMGMTMGLLPVVGIPLPFISYGGSNTVVNFSLLGLVLNISMRRFVFKG